MKWRGICSERIEPESSMKPWIIVTEHRPSKTLREKNFGFIICWQSRNWNWNWVVFVVLHMICIIIIIIFHVYGFVFCLALNRSYRDRSR